MITRIYQETRKFQINEDKQNTELPGNVELLIRLSMLEAIFSGETNREFVYVSKKSVQSVKDYLSFIDTAYQQELNGSVETPETIKEKIINLIQKKGEVFKRDISNGIKIKSDYPPK